MRFHPFLNLVSALAVPIVCIAMIPLAGAAMAQGPSAAPAGISPTAAAIYDSSHRIKTNVPGVTAFPDLPAGFDAVNASAEQRAAYGLPPAPNQAAHPKIYAKWAKAMSMIGHAKHYTGPLTVTKGWSMPARPAGKPTARAADGTISVSFNNWSGVANLTNATSWGANSIYLVVSEFNVPVAQEAFDYCDGIVDWEVSWNGIDGYSNGDVLQGGSSSQASCSGGVTSTSYCAWVEWYPSYPILCEYKVNPGDDMLVETYATGPTNGYVFVYDLTLNIYADVNLVPTEPPYLVGNSAEYIVERPGCGVSCIYPLANYVEDFWAANYAYTNSGVLSYPGQTGPNTSLITMLSDTGIPISYTPEIGPPFQILFNDENCAYSGGCQP
jgi:hypothetical protein